MRSILAITLLLLATAADAGTITITVTRASGTCSTPCTKTYTDTDANLARLVPVFQASCNATLVQPAPPASPITCTPVQILAYIFDNFIKSLILEVKEYDRNVSFQAIVPPAPINPQ
jgi:hypothetical protein